MTEQVTYACPMPDCGWHVTDTHKETLSAVVFLKLAERHDIPAELVQHDMNADHDQKLADTIMTHLRSHPELAADPNIPAAAGYLIQQARQAITQGGGGQ